jgi:serine/threonine protein kinase/tetratricopeptide (TPR) repeat protein
MDQDRWKIITDIFHSALELSASERREFVVRASGGDEALAAQVNLLLEADAEAGSYLTTACLESSDFRSVLHSRAPVPLPGEVLCGRFQIVRAVGEGGMGHVFEAVDMALGVRVALKMIRPEIAENTEALSRFRREVRLARRITHANVCRTFDLERDVRGSMAGATEIVFLTMEFLEGETLARRLRRDGALPLNEALEVARQVAAGLEAAKGLGVVHRDIKPGNIMLVPSQGNTSGPRAVITDFGLAHAEDTDGSRSVSGIQGNVNPIGTPAYMAPEQLDGKDVSPATDVYAFGLVLFEMATGQRALPGKMPLGGIAEPLPGLPPRPAVVSPELPDCWQRAIVGCLRTKQEERFASAMDAVAVLEAGEHVSTQVDRPRDSRPPHPGWPLRKRIAAGLSVSCVVVSLFWIGIRYRWTGEDPRVVPGALVYLAPLKNETGEQVLDSVSELIRAGLTQSVQINLLDIARVGDTLQRMTKPPNTAIDEPTAREIAMRTNAVRVVFVTVRGSSGKYELGVDVEQPDNTPARARKHWKRSFPWRANVASTVRTIPAELFSAARDASGWIRLEVGESHNDIARLDAPPEDVTTANWEALEDYTQSVRLVQSGQTEAAIYTLEHAVGADPNFALAWGRMGDLLVSVGRDTDGYRAYDRALDASNQRRLTRREEDRIRGMRAVDTADYELAVLAFHDYAVNYPNDYAAWTYPLRALRMLGREEEAITYLERALTLEPNQPFAPFELTAVLIATGRRKEGLDQQSKLRRSFPDLADRIEILVAMLDGHYDAATAIADRTLKRTSVRHRSYGYEELASLMADRGMYDVAIQVLNEGIDDDTKENRPSRHAWKLVDRAYLKMKADKLEECLADTQAAIQENKSPWMMIAVANVLGNAVTMRRPEYRPQIRAQLSRMRKIASATADAGRVFELAELRIQGEFEFAEENARQSVAIFRRAAVADGPAEGREYLARALLAAAESEQDSEKADAEMRESLRLYALTATRPAFIWVDLSGYLPGFYGDQLERFVKISKIVKFHDQDVAHAEERLQALRQNR